MCRGKSSCSELGTNPQHWSSTAPLEIPQWFRPELSLFANAVYEASVGNVKNSLHILSAIQSNNLREWYVEHGQMSGYFRTKILNVTPLNIKNPELDSLRSPDKFSKEVFSRDGYTCRYCGIGVIPKNILDAYSKAIGKRNFRSTGTNQERHGVVPAFRANADHVFPWKLGGKTNPDNLVTSCWSCNYGKAEYTLEELNLVDPRNTTITTSEWDGLISLKKGLKENAL